MNTINHVNKNDDGSCETENILTPSDVNLVIPTCVYLILIDSAETETRSQYSVIVPCQSVLEQDDRNSE